MKKCNTCHIIKDLAEFYKDSAKSFGVRGTCKSCDSIRKKHNYLKNLEKYKCYRKNYYIENKMACNKRSKTYYETHKESQLAWQRDYLKDPEIYAKSQATKRRHYDRNIKKIKNRAKQWRLDNRERYTEQNQEHYQQNREERLKQSNQYKKENPAKVNAWNAKRRAQKLQATPKWLTDDDFRFIHKFYEESDRLTKETGVQYNVDHIVPLQGKNVSGLHVPWNLQVITEKENNRKHNKLVDIV